MTKKFRLRKTLHNMEILFQYFGWHGRQWTRGSSRKLSPTQNLRRLRHIWFSCVQFCFWKHCDWLSCSLAIVTEWIKMKKMFKTKFGLLVWIKPVTAQLAGETSQMPNMFTHFHHLFLNSIFLTPPYGGHESAHDNSCTRTSPNQNPGERSCTSWIEYYHQVGRYFQCTSSASSWSPKKPDFLSLFQRTEFCLR